MVAQSAGVDGIGDEVVTQRVHLHEGRHPRGVAEVVGIDTARERRARRRLDRGDLRVDLARELLAQEGEGQAREVGAAAGAADDVGRGVAGHLELEQGLLADHRLMQQHVIEHRAERVARVGVGGSDLDGLGDRDAEGPRPVVGVLGELAADRGDIRGRPVDRGAEGLDHEAAVGLGVVRRTHLPHLALEVVEGAGEGERRTPLARTGLGGELLGAFLLVVIGLGHRGIGLVRSGRRDTLVLVVDASRGAEQLLESMRAEERGRTPLAVDIEHATGDFDVPLAGDLLHDEVHREERSEIVRPNRVHAARMQRRRRRSGQVGDEVVPGRRHLVLAEHVLVLLHGVVHGVRLPTRSG